MTIEKAIEILEEEIGGMLKAGGGDWDDAILLGIEALKRVCNLRNGCHFVGMPPLKGETKED